MFLQKDKFASQVKQKDRTDIFVCENEEERIDSFSNLFKKLTYAVQ